MIIKVTAWSNGGGTYGIRLAKTSVKKHFSPELQTVEVEVDGQRQVYRLRKTFWTTCPELRGGVIGQWLQQTGLAPWPKGEAPVLALEVGKGTQLHLRKSEE